MVVTRVIGDGYMVSVGVRKIRKRGGVMDVIS